jgi:hypothetical protein
MKAAILQSNYIPWKGYFDLIHDVDFFVFYDCVQYTKNDWRNRNLIYINQNPQWLTIPIGAESTSLMIDQVTPLNSKWQDLHFKTLYLGYKRAPYFHQLETLMLEIYKNHQWQSLSELNQFIIKEISQKIGIKTQFYNSRDLDIAGDRIQRLVNICQQLNASEYISGASAKNYLDGKENLFLQNNIHLTYKEYPNYQPYSQLFTPFVQAVSIVDMIANIHWDDIKNHIWNS